jgi:hypothetical protein
VLGHPEVETAMRDEFVEFFERAGIEQEVDPLAGGQFARGMLPPQSLLAAPKLRSALEAGEYVFGLQAFTA